jgi:ATP-dependent DNA helicase RecG
MGILSVTDLLCHMPVRYEDRSRLTPVKALVPGEPAAVRAVVVECELRKAKQKNLQIVTLAINDGGGGARVVLFSGGSFGGFANAKIGATILLYGSPRFERGFMEFTSPDWLLLRPGDEAPSDWLRIVPVYPTVAELPKKQLASIIYSCVTSAHLLVRDLLPEEIIKRRSLPSLADAFRGVHAPRALDEIAPSRRRLVYQELYEVQHKIFESAAARREARAFSLKRGISVAQDLIASFPFDMTESQRAAADEISADLCRTEPMHRLLQGDVGSGKTSVAACAIAQCVGAGRQAAVLAPTTVLSDQFYSECVKFLGPLGIKCAELLGGTSPAERREILRSLRSGETDVLIGAHALLSDGVEFKSLGLVVIDEQHRFGVLQRERLARAEPHRGEKKSSALPHTLLMSATPIPRTLCMALYGDVSLTLISGKPPGRQPAATKIVSDNHTDDVYSFIKERIGRGERCYWVCPSIGDEGAGGKIAERSKNPPKNFSPPRGFPVLARASDMGGKIAGVRIEVLHGRMPREEKAEAMARFASGESDVLVATTVIEVGLDVAEATVIVVESATNFGLSQLHQLRGRVGRGGGRSFCILLDSAVNIKGNERLQVLKNSDDGFLIAEEDLKQRGAGEIAGLRQHGELSFQIANLIADADLLKLAREDAGQDVPNVL